MNRIHMCGTKRRYDTEDIAKEARDRMAKKEPHERVNVYFCEFCHYWHIGTDRNLQPGMKVGLNRTISEVN